MKTDELRNKIAAFKAATKTKKSLVPTMITTFGVKRNQYSGKVQQEVVLDDLFAGKRYDGGRNLYKKVRFRPLSLYTIILSSATKKIV